jgi:hypothetical protein
VTHHQTQVAATRQVDQLLSIGGAVRQGFLNQDVLAAQQGIARDSVVRRDRRRDDYRVDLGGSQDFMVVALIDGNVCWIWLRRFVSRSETIATVVSGNSWKLRMTFGPQ